MNARPAALPAQNLVDADASEIANTMLNNGPDLSNRFARIIETSLNEIYIFDGETCKFIQVNEGARRNLGFSMAELEGKTAWDIKPEVAEPLFREIVKPLVTGEKEVIQFETVHQRKNGTTYPVEVHLQLYSDQKPAVYVAIILDISERKRVERLNSRYGHIFESSLNEIYIFDGETCKFIQVNEGARRNLGYSMAELEGMTAWDIKPEIEEPLFREMVSPLVDGKEEILQFETVHQRKDGTRYSVEVHLQRFSDEGAPVFVAIILDISERKEIEDAIMSLNRDLEDRVEQRTLELRKTNGDLQEILGDLKAAQSQLVESEKMASLGQLVAGIAHEINTPVGIGVTAITHLQEQAKHFGELYNSNNMKRADFEKFLSSALEATDIVYKNLDRASHLIRSFKNVAVDQSSEEPRIIDLKGYLKDNIVSLRPKLKQAGHNITLHCDDDVHILSQPGAISQVVTNLIMNSIVHAYDDGERGEIAIVVTRSSGAINITYEDDGKGIPKDLVKRVFDPFFTTKRGSGGSGLGLHIIYNLVTQTLGGSIACDSAIGEGTVFEIKFSEMEGVAA